MWTFYNPVRILFGRGIAARLGDVISSGRPLIVSGAGATRELAKGICSQLSNFDPVLFSEVEANPSSQTTEKGVQIARDQSCDSVIGVGGGSPLDCAKAIALFSNSQANVLEVMRTRKPPHQPGLPFFAIPTTAGTGSEVTQYSILTDTEKKKKLSIADPCSFPNTAILDPDLTVGMSAEITASTGLDVLAHAIESAWNKLSNPVSEMYAFHAVRLVFANLEKAVKDGENHRAREAMLRASMYAGLAISGTGTTINHSISYPLTLYRDVAHGFACAISLPAVMRYNYPTAQDVLDRLAAFCNLKGGEGLVAAVENLMQAINAPMRLSQANISPDDLDWLTKESYTKNVAKNPRPLEESDMHTILKEML